MEFDPPPTQAMIAVGQLALSLQNLRPRLAADHSMKIAHHRRIRMRAQHAAQQVVRGAHVGHPVAHGFVDRVFQCARAGSHAAHFGAQQAHAKDIQFLPPHVFRAHVDDALEAQQRAHGGGGDAMLSGAGFGDHAMLAHALDQQRLSQAVVDLVRAGVQQVFALQIDLGAAQFFRQALREKQRRGTPGKSAQQYVKTLLEFRILLRFLVIPLQFVERRHQRLGNIAPAIDAKSPSLRAVRRLRSLLRSAEAFLRSDMYLCGCHLCHGSPKRFCSCRARPE